MPRRLQRCSDNNSNNTKLCLCTAPYEAVAVASTYAKSCRRLACTHVESYARFARSPLPNSSLTNGCSLPRASQPQDAVIQSISVFSIRFIVRRFFYLKSCVVAIFSCDKPSTQYYKEFLLASPNKFLGCRNSYTVKRSDSQIESLQ